jgi:uncharacterized protein with GYD domain
MTQALKPPTQTGLPVAPARPRTDKHNQQQHEKENIMSRYISLLRFTEQGAKNVKKSTARAHAFDKLAAKARVKVEGQYWTMGKYDGVLILNADSETKVLHLLTMLASLGNVRTATMQAFSDKEFDAIA